MKEEEEEEFCSELSRVFCCAAPQAVELHLSQNEPCDQGVVKGI
jgi:hypothetical protein